MSKLGTGTDGTVWAFAKFNGSIIAAGNFTNANGVTCNSIARYTGSTFAPLGTGLSSGIIYCLKVYRNKLYAGGNFSSIGGVSANNLAVWDGSTWAAVGSGTDGEIPNLEVEPLHNALVVSGTFWNINGMRSTNVAIYNGTRFYACPNADMGDIASVVTGGGRIFIMGDMYGLYGLDCQNIGELKPTWSVVP